MISTCIKSWLDSRPKIKEYLWFAALSLGGMASMACITFIIKLMMKFLK